MDTHDSDAHAAGYTEARSSGLLPGLMVLYSLMITVLPFYLGRSSENDLIDRGDRRSTDVPRILIRGIVRSRAC